MIRQLSIAAVSVALIGSSLAAVPAHAILPATPVTRADLPTVANLKAVDGVSAFRVVATRTGESKIGTAACQQRTWASMKPNTVLSRDCTAKGDSPARASIASFHTHAQAVAAASTMARGFTGCAARLVKQNPDLLRNYKEYRRSVVLPGGQTAYLWTMNGADGESGERFVATAGVVATGTHVALVQISFGGNGSMDTRNIQRVMTASVRTLA